MRWGKPDDSAKDIDKYMLTVGASIMKLDSLGDGWPDRCYGIRGINVLAELKTGKRKREKNQTKRAVEWRGAPICLLRTPEDARAALLSYGLRV